MHVPTRDRDRELRLPRQLYRLRMLGLAVGSLAVAAVFEAQRASSIIWTVLLINAVAWPHRIELQQVLANVIRNAIEAMDATPLSNRRLIVETPQVDRRVRVSVTDSGPGVDPSIAPTPFHPFHTTKPSGLGLGLSICHSLVESHGGRIGSEPQIAGGTTFVFELPAAASGAPA